MSTLKNWLFTAILFFVITVAFSQAKITGIVSDGKENLANANVNVKGTTKSTTTDATGKFVLNTTANSGQLIISHTGYSAKTISFSGSQNLGVIVLNSNSNDLKEVVITTGVADIAKDRKTPVAVSTIKGADIQEKVGNQEFPEVLKTTPSVYVSKSGGGFGDSRLTIRGFDQRNIAVLINGMPVNDMENGTVYWSNLAGLSDVTSSMQVQRGLGASKLAISSVGGTVNVITKTSEMREGGVVGATVGNNSSIHTQASYNTGLLSNGFSASILLGTNTGNGYVEGTHYDEKSYFLGLGYKPNKKHDFQFIFTGTAQWHEQRTAAITIETYQNTAYGGSKDKPNIKYNSDWGYLNGSRFTMKQNFYNKPIVSFNWDYKINENTKLSTIVYGSWGRGGGTSGVGGINKANYLDKSFRTKDGLVDFDKIQAANLAKPLVNGQHVNGATNIDGISRTASINSHDWYGAISKLDTKIAKNINLNVGVDARVYKGIHYQYLTSLLGADAYLDNTNVNNTPRYLTEIGRVTPSLNPFASSSFDQKVGYDYDGDVFWGGFFSQIEYSNKNLTAYVQSATSVQGFKKVDRFTYKSTDALSSTPYQYIPGGNIKLGANYNINKQHNVFFNTGYYTKQPFFNAVYPGNKSVVNPFLVNEQIRGLEGGYGFRSKFFTANVNVYYTFWKDRNLRVTDLIDKNNNGGYYDYRGLSEKHIGAELEMTARISDKFRLNGMLSVGNWTYQGNATNNKYDQQNNLLNTSTLYLDKIKVGDAAQTTATLGGTYEITKGLKVDATYNYAKNLYGSIDPAKFDKEDNKGALELPSFGLFDAGATYNLQLSKTKKNMLSFRANVNNVFDKIYIAESKTNIFTNDKISSSPNSKDTYESVGKVYNGIAIANQVFFGFGRTWNCSVRYSF